LPPRRLLFFQSDWTLLITEITGIDDAALIDFDPSSRNPTIRQRMSWAAHRKTTEIEDVSDGHI
jgi:hypothetical protein